MDKRATVGQVGENVDYTYVSQHTVQNSVAVCSAFQPTRTIKQRTYEENQRPEGPPRRGISQNLSSAVLYLAMKHWSRTNNL